MNYIFLIIVLVLIVCIFYLLKTIYYNTSKKYLNLNSKNKPDVKEYFFATVVTPLERLKFSDMMISIYQPKGEDILQIKDRSNNAIFKKEDIIKANDTSTNADIIKTKFLHVYSLLVITDPDFQHAVPNVYTIKQTMDTQRNEKYFKSIKNLEKIGLSVGSNFMIEDNSTNLINLTVKEIKSTSIGGDWIFNSDSEYWTLSDVTNNDIQLLKDIKDSTSSGIQYAELDTPEDTLCKDLELIETKIKDKLSVYHWKSDELDKLGGKDGISNILKDGMVLEKVVPTNSITAATDDQYDILDGKFYFKAGRWYYSYKPSCEYPNETIIRDTDIIIFTKVTTNPKNYVKGVEYIVNNRQDETPTTDYLCSFRLKLAVKSGDSGCDYYGGNTNDIWEGKKKKK